jgi:PAS domain S-box-containing protein
MSTLRILHLEDNEIDAELIKRTLKQSGMDCAIQFVCTRDEFCAALRHPVDVVISDFCLPTYTGLEALAEVRALFPHLPFICVSGTIGEELAVELLHKGATDYVLKQRLVRLPEAIHRAIKEAAQHVAQEHYEAGLRQRESIIRSAFDNSPLGMALFSLNGNCTRVNGALCKMSGRAQSDLLETPYAMLIHPEDRPGNETAILALLNCSGRVYRFESQCVRPDKSVRWLLHNITLVDDESGQPAQFFAQVQDITERKDVERMLERRVEERTVALSAALDAAERARKGLDTVFETISDGLVVTDEAGNVVMFNSRLKDWFSADSSAIGRPLESAFSGVGLQNALAQATSTRKPVRYEHNPVADGPQVPFAIKVIPMLNNEESFQGAVTAIQDITYFRDAERAKDDFINFAAHELRTPLTTILGYAELLNTRTLAENIAKNYISVLFRQAQHLGNLVNDLLDLSRLQQGKSIPLDRQTIDLAAMARELVGAFKNLSGAHCYSVKANPDPFPANCDPSKIQQVIQNLLSNARKYSTGGSIELTLSANENRDVIIEISDQGIGMTSEQAARAFERFYRADSSNTRAPGTGLGMPIVKAIVEQHGGSVRVESELGKGTRVIVSLTNALCDKCEPRAYRSNMILRAIEGPGEN